MKIMTQVNGLFMEEIIKNYMEIQFSKKVKGNYNLKEFVKLENMEEEDDEQKIIESFEYAFAGLKQYPKYGEVYYTLLNQKYIEKKRITDISKENGITITTIYRKTEKALGIMAEIFNAKMEGAV